MIWGYPIFLLIFLHRAGSVLKANCSNEICQCGNTVTITCDLNCPLQNFSLYHNGNPLTERELSKNDGNISIELKENKRKILITFSNIKFSDVLQYELTLEAEEVTDNRRIHFKVTGICKPEISENTTTNELECEVESEKEVSIVWTDEHGTIYKEARTEELSDLNSGFKFRSFLKLTDEIKGKPIKCSVPETENGVYKHSKLYTSKTADPTDPGKLINPSKNLTLSIVLFLLAVALVAAAFGYLLKKRNLAVHSASQGVLLWQEVPEDMKIAN